MSHKVALITGASRGLGEFLARRFWDAGFSLCLTASNLSRLQDVSRSLQARSHQSIHLIDCDLSNASAASHIYTETRRCFSHIDVLINNAAVQGQIGPLYENDMNTWQRTIQINLLSPVSICHHFIPWMAERKRGVIINLSGGGATGPRPFFSAYGASKTALVRLSETVAEEVKHLGIRVNCIAPGAMKTEMLKEVLDTGAHVAGENEFAAASKVFSNGGASMDSVADLALFLASDDSQGITGKIISAMWDNWPYWSDHIEELASGDLYTLRRVTGRDRGLSWGDK